MQVRTPNPLRRNAISIAHGVDIVSLGYMFILGKFLTP